MGTVKKVLSLLKLLFIFITKMFSKLTCCLLPVIIMISHSKPAPNTETFLSAYRRLMRIYEGVLGSGRLEDSRFDMSMPAHKTGIWSLELYPGVLGSGRLESLRWSW